LGIPQIATTLAFVGSQFKLTEEAQKLSDLWIEPDVNKFNLLDYAKFPKVAEAGYVEAKEAIKRWKDRLAQSDNPPAWLQTKPVVDTVTGQVAADLLTPTPARVASYLADSASWKGKPTENGDQVVAY
jgi:hypothetical protein